MKLDRTDIPKHDWKAYDEYSPPKVMEIFKKVFLTPLSACEISIMPSIASIVNDPRYLLLIANAQKHWTGPQLRSKWHVSTVKNWSNPEAILERTNDLEIGKCTDCGFMALGHNCSWKSEFHCINYHLDYYNDGWGGLRGKCLAFLTDHPVSVFDPEKGHIRCRQQTIECNSCNKSYTFITKNNDHLDVCQDCMIAEKELLADRIPNDLVYIIMGYHHSENSMKKLKSTKSLLYPQDWFTNISSNITLNGVRFIGSVNNGYRDKNERKFEDLNSSDTDADKDFM